MKTSTVMTIALALGSPVFAQKVSVEYAHQVDFSKFNTYRWGKNKGELPDRTEDQHIKNKLDRVLQAKNLRRVDSRMADVVLTYQATVVNTQQEVDTYAEDDDVGIGLGWGWGLGWGAGWGDYDPGFSGSTLVNVKKGDLLVDIVDPANKRMLFRGYASGAFHEDPVNEDKLMSKAIDKMFKKFPPKEK
ncbi:MAG TPA: DUF4136 domain-containing protein [Bryobacteraceae bacterium]|nr:DUF4136 domain-containing protein [Bryobacteraceae bacterium]